MSGQPQVSGHCTQGERVVSIVTQELDMSVPNLHASGSSLHSLSWAIGCCNGDK